MSRSESPSLDWTTRRLPKKRRTIIRKAAPKDRNIPAMLIDALVTWSLETHLCNDPQLCDTIKISINRNLSRYNDGAAVLTAGQETGAEARTLDYALSWEPSKPLIMQCIMKTILDGKLEQESVGVFVGSRNRFKLLLKPILKCMLDRDGDALLAAGEIADLASTKTMTSLVSYGQTVLNYVQCFARSSAAARRQTAFVEIQNSNDNFGEAARGAGLVFDGESRPFVTLGLKMGHATCARLVSAKK